MKNQNFHSNKLGSMRNIRLRNLIMIVLSIIFGFGSIAVFAFVNIETNISNAIQTIKRIIISSDGSDDEATRLFDINTGTKIKLYTNNLSWTEATDLTGVNKILGIDNNGEMIFISKNIALSGTNGVGITGAVGPAGPAGATGPAGPAGLQGNTGAAGTGLVDNLGNHIAEKNIMIGSNWITYNSGTAQLGLRIFPAGNIQISSTIQISNLSSSPNCNASKSGTISYTNGCFQGCDGTSRTNLGGNCSSICGDGNKEGGEQCDDNNTSNGDGCNSSCQRETRYTLCSSLPPNTVANNATGILQTCLSSDGNNCNLRNPNNTYTYNTISSDEECRYICAAGYNRNGSACVLSVACGNGSVQAGEQCDDNNTSNGDGCNSSCQRETQTYTCSPKPITGTIWNTVSNYIQTCSVSNGTTCTSRLPANSPTTYNTSPTTTGCNYTCNAGYNRSGSACVLSVACGNGSVQAGEQCDDNNTSNGDGCNSSCQRETQTYTCSPKPIIGTLWNTVSGYTQTCSVSNGILCTSWIPANSSTTYNTSPTTTGCHYTCNTNYIYSGGTCEAATSGPVACTGLIANTQWNTATSIIQTWNGYFWTPSTTGTYNTSVSTTHCHYMCINGYTWDGTGACIENGSCGDGIVISPEQCDNGISNSSTGECSTTCNYNTPSCSIYINPSILIGGSGTSTITGDISPRADYTITTHFPDGSDSITHILTGVGTTQFSTRYTFPKTGEYTMYLGSEDGAGVKCESIVNVYTDGYYACGPKHNSDNYLLSPDDKTLCITGYTADNFTGDASTIKNVLPRLSQSANRAVIYFITSDIIVPSYSYIDTGKQMVLYSGLEYIMWTGNIGGFINVVLLLPQQGYKYRTRECLDPNTNKPAGNKCYAHKKLDGDCSYDMNLDDSIGPKVQNLTAEQIQAARINRYKILTCVLDEPRIDSENNAQQYKYTRGILDRTPKAEPACQVITGNPIEQSLFYIHRVCPGYNYGTRSESCDMIYQTGFEVTSCTGLLQSFYGIQGNTGSFGQANG